MRYQTFDEWAAEGYHVVRGERSLIRNPMGVPLFAECQVEANDAGFDPMPNIDSLFDCGDSDDPLDNDPYLYT